MELLTPREVCALLKVSPRTLRRLRVPRVRIGRAVRYSRTAILKWLQAREE